MSATDLLWTGRPAGGVRFSRSDWYLVPFSLLWASFAVFWETEVIHSGAPLIMKLWGIPFILIGIYVVAGRFFADAYRRGATWYAVTPDAALILRQGLGGGLQRLYLPSIHSIGLVLGQGGSGSISFGNPPVASGLGGRGFGIWSGAPYVPSFEGIDDAQRVYDLCIKGQRSATSAAPGA